jgi:hypothetical protein
MNLLPFRGFTLLTTAGFVFRVERLSSISWRADWPDLVGIRWSQGSWAVMALAEIAAIQIESESEMGLGSIEG